MKKSKLSGRRTRVDPYWPVPTMSGDSKMDFLLEVFRPQSTPDRPYSRASASLDDFIFEFRTNDWVKYAAQTPWARNGWSGLAVERLSDELRFWVCAYDWAADLGYEPSEPLQNPLIFIIGLTNLSARDGTSYIAAGRRLVDCDFAVTEPKQVEHMAGLFFAGDIERLINLLLQHEPVNRFS